MVKILGHNIGGGGSPERPRPTREEEQFLRGLEAEERATGYPSIVPKKEADILGKVFQRTGDQRFRVG